VASELAAVGGPRVVALSGGVFQNDRLTTATRQGLEHAGFEVLTHRRVPPNDGGLALGQLAVLAARRHRARHDGTREPHRPDEPRPTDDRAG
jgi:hydrogenase maturation protein HypF